MAKSRSNNKKKKRNNILSFSFLGLMVFGLALVVGGFTFAVALDARNTVDSCQTSVSGNVQTADCVLDNVHLTSGKTYYAPEDKDDNVIGPFGSGANNWFNGWLEDYLVETLSYDSSAFDLECSGEFINNIEFCTDDRTLAEQFVVDTWGVNASTFDFDQRIIDCTSSTPPNVCQNHNFNYVTDAPELTANSGFTSSFLTPVESDSSCFVEFGGTKYDGSFFFDDQAGYRLACIVSYGSEVQVSDLRVVYEIGADPEESCTTEFAPVCGTDGQTYDNSCLANKAGVEVDSQGECQGGSNNTGNGNKTEEKMACEDGLDNDGDDLIDLNDPGCDSPSDDSEFNELPPKKDFTLTYIGGALFLIGGGGFLLTRRKK